MFSFEDFPSREPTADEMTALRLATKSYCNRTLQDRTMLPTQDFEYPNLDSVNVAYTNVTMNDDDCYISRYPSDKTFQLRVDIVATPTFASVVPGTPAPSEDELRKVLYQSSYIRKCKLADVCARSARTVSLHTVLSLVIAGYNYDYVQEIPSSNL